MILFAYQLEQNNRNQGYRPNMSPIDLVLGITLKCIKKTIKASKKAIMRIIT